ncbi:MAG: CaiB/BaiF CoA transferase family protein [Dehalococcoidia bacterium]
MAGPLAGVTVLEVGSGVAVGYCGRLLAGFGATVVKVEPPAGDSARRARVVVGAPSPSLEAAPQFLYLGAGKRSVVLDLDGGVAQLRALAAEADVVLCDQPGRQFDLWGIGYDALAAADPGAILVSLRPYGDWGPWAGWKAENINAFAMGGQMALTGELSREPLCTAGEQAWMQLGLHGFAATCFALYGVGRSGLGQHVEVSAAECMAGASEGFGPNARFTGRVVPRSGRARFSMMGIYPCLDGYAGIYGTHRQIPPFARLSGHEELLAPGRFTKLPDILAAQDELLGIVLEYFDQRTKTQVMAEGRASSMTIAPVHTVPEVAANPHLNDRGFFVERTLADGRRLKQPGRPFRMSATPWTDAPAPHLGELPPGAAAAALRTARAPFVRDPAATVRQDRDHRGLLAGVRVLDFTAYWAGPYATKWLADFGADVIKVESPALYDFIRSTANDFARPRVYDYSAYFNNYNRGKRSLSVDPAHPDGKAMLMELVRGCDVVVENFKARRMDNLGFTYDALRAVRPDIIVASISGYGQDGPDHSLAGVGTNMEQLSGIASLNAYEDAPQPYNTGIAYGDPTSGTTGAAAIAMALLHRDRTGEGQYIEITGQETLVSLIGEQFAALSLGLEPAAKGNRHPDMAPHGCYPCAGDDRWVTIAVRAEADWRGLCDLIGAPGLAELDSLEARQASALEVDAAIMGWTLGRSDYEAALALQAAGVAAAPVLHALDLVEDPHYRVRGYFQMVTHPDMGAYPHDGVAWRLSRTPGGIAAPAPLFGEHTRQVLSETFGVAAERIDALYASGAAADAPFR